MLRRLVVVLAGVAVLLGGALPALAAGPPISCPPGTEPSPRTGECIIVVTDPGGGGGGSGGGGGDAKPVSLPTCTLTLTSPTKVVPCSSSDGWWVQSQQCYAKVLQPKPPFSDPAWGGRTTGQVYECTRPVGTGPVSGIAFWLWLATPPNGAPPDPQVLARQAVARMNLRAINIGIVPQPGAGSVGIIGMPTWMWAQNPGATTWGPQTQSASAGGFTVTATAKAERTVWAMGDGATVTCTGPGTPYADSYGKQSSPTCGHTYTRQGTYTVRATTYWVVSWAGIGLSGTIPLDFTDATTITMGEAQVLSS